jgi:hypothetical protein
LSAAQIAFDLQNPIAIARVEQPLPEGWEIGFCLAATGQTDAAIEHLRKGARLASIYAPVWEHLVPMPNRDAIAMPSTRSKERRNSCRDTSRLGNIWRKYHVVGRTADADQAVARAARLKNTPPQVAKRKG